MPTCLTHFCAEWRRARRVLSVQNLDLETKRELYGVLTSDLLVGCDGPLAERHGVGFWQADFDEAAGVRIWLMQTGTVVAGSTDEVDTNDGDNQPDESLSTASRSINLRSKSGALGLLKGLAARPSPKKLDDQASVFSWNLQQVGAAKSAAAGEHHLLFRNPDHPMSQFPNEANKDEFVGLMKKSLMAESLFSEGVGPHHKNEEQAIATTQDAEDLFEALLIHQQICRLTSGSVLQLGRVMDELVRRWSILTKFRQLIERDTATIGTFIQTYFLTPKVKYIDSNEIYHFFRGGPGLRDVTVEEVLSSLDEDGDGKVDLQECQRQLSLVAPPRPSLLELGSQLELKHGLGRSAISSGLKEPASLFEHLCTVEKVSPPPEDVARLYRAINSSRASREIGTESLSQMLRQPPLDIQWGVEVHTIPALYDALACRMLTVERSRQKDAAVLPPEAFVQGEVPELPELERRFAHLWDMYGSSLVGSVSAQSASKFREHCFAMYQHHADQIAVWRSNHSGELRRGQMVSVHKSLFPSIGDVVTTASCRLVAGQTCVVRYRLQGPCSYYGSGHTVLKDEREPVPWPVPRKVLGDTPFIALVPPGLSYCAAGGGGFYLGHQAFNNVDPNLRADLPKSSDGQPQMLGHVEMSMPSFSRSQRGGSGKMPKSQVFELRLFCSSKQRIIGCIGEPVQMTVWNQMPPPPLESLQLRCEGRNVTLRWNALELLDLPKEAQADHVRVLVKTSTSEETVVLKPEVTEHELQDLIPDTEYEFRVRAENVAGSSRDCVAHCRINAYCPAPAGLTCASIGTAQVELEWSRPGKIGNEATKDAFQIHTEQIQRYIATLRVVDTTGEDGNEEGSDGSSPRSDKPHRSRKRAQKHNLNPDAVKERPCQWLPEALREDRGRGIIQATLLGLRPDTRYMLFGLCAENSVGSGACSPNLEFWTIPLVPRVERCRVRQGQVLLALSETGGACVHEYAVSVLKEGMPEDNAVSWTIPQAALQPEGEAEEVNAGAAEVVRAGTPQVRAGTPQVRAGTPQGVLQLPELPLPFAEMPAAESTEKHFLRLRARNSGGWSEWSPSFTTAAISRQQGADLAEAAIIAAITSPSIEQLEQVLRASKGIEFQDYKYVHEARALLLRLREVKNDLADAMKARFPEQLREALQAAIDAKLQGIDKARSLLDKLDLVVERLDTAKGLTPLKAAIEAAETARLPEEIIVVGRERLIRREAAQQGLEEAIEAARVPDLLEALKAAEGMDLPAEPEARERVELLGQTQGALQKAMSTKVIPDLSAALTLASKAGLKEHQMIHEARSLLSKLMNRRENVKKELEKAVKFRHPVKLKMTIMSARLAQVSLKRILDAEEVRKRVEELLEAMADAAGIEEREKTLADAVAYSIPAELLKRFEIELEELKALHDAIRHGDPEVLRECIEKCEDLGIKVVELLEARVLYRDWEAACQKIEVEASVQRVEPLRTAIKAAKDLGVNALVLARGNELLRHLEKRIRMEQELGEALKVHKLEIIASAVRAAGDAGAHDHSLVTRSHDMLEVLQTKRDKLQAASERAELHLMHETLNTVVQSPALPDSETSRAFLKMRALRKKEQIQIVSRLKLAQEAKDFRCGSVLLDRMVTARKADVDMDSQHIGSTEWMQLAEVEQRERIEKDILQERLSRKQMVLSDQAPEASASYILSTGAIVGTMKVLFEPVGTQICILPREIVEANLQVNLEVGKGIPEVGSPKAVTPKKLQTLEGEANIQKSLGVIRKIIGRGDEVKCLRPIDLSWEENARESAFRTLRGLMQVPIAIYIRRDHQCLEIADAICRRCHLGADLWQSDALPSSVIHPLDFCTDPDPVTEDCSTKLRWDDADDALAALSRELASSLVQVSRSITPPCSKQLADYTRSVRARVFRSLHLDFAWTYPKGIFDSLDASCLMFDQERLLDIIDGRGSQASKYGIINSGPYGVAYERRSKSKESSPVHHASKEKISAINMFSETNYAESRQGKRTVEVRIDMIPSHVTDLVFVVSPTNSRDLSKFTDLQSMVIDAESSEVLASSSVEEQISPGHECAVMLSVYRLDDHLWHVNKIDAFGKGSHRDYKPVIAKVLSLGYPRKQAMKNLVPDVLKRIQAELSVPHPVKDTNVRVSRKNALEFGYAVELTGDQKTLSSEMLQRIADPMFIEALAETLYDSSSNRISKSHLTISEASYGEAWNLEFEFKYKFPEQEEDTEEDPTNCYLDATCVLFEGQALREVVDYRGAHGIRWVTNGVLDYRGYWVGQIPIGDASGGAVHHIGGSQNYAAREGKTACQVELDKLPANVTDVFFVLSNHTTPVGAFSGVSLQVKDVNHPGHEVTGVYELAASDPKESALVACRCSRSPALETGLCEDTWTLDMMSISCGGHAMDYRPALQSLYAAQAATRNTRSVQWPCRGGNSPRGALQDRPYGLPAIKRPMNDLPMLGVNSELPEGLARVRTPSRDESLPPVSARNRQPDAAVPSAGYGKQGSLPKGDPGTMSLTPLPPLDSPKALASTG
ncbi:unnamed protein product [Symbiodinium sp. CCMP2456]|nr:unnamed protein product [Symbiodinium sp. CCMP2456]